MLASSITTTSPYSIGTGTIYTTAYGAPQALSIQTGNIQLFGSQAKPFQATIYGNGMTTSTYLSTQPLTQDTSTTTSTGTTAMTNQSLTLGGINTIQTNKQQLFSAWSAPSLSNVAQAPSATTGFEIGVANTAAGINKFVFNLPIVGSYFVSQVQGFNTSENILYSNAPTEQKAFAVGHILLQIASEAATGYITTSLATFPLQALGIVSASTPAELTAEQALKGIPTITPIQPS